ncbi:hypothetical protein JXL19_00465 [bacterium]|nr:hypothetical protein [bacterium]
MECFENLGSLSLWLEIHIFLGILGPILIIFHSALRFNGVIGLAFWFMVIVVISGIFGRVFFGQCFWNITKKFELLQDIDIFLEKDLKEASVSSNIVRRVMELRPPGFPNNYGVIKNLGQWRYIKKEASNLFLLIDEQYGNPGSEEYNVLQKWATDLVKRLREIRYISVLDLYLSILNKWVIIHKFFSYILFIIMVFHILVTVYWGYRWIL